MLGLNLIGQVANLAGTMIEGKTAVKKAEAETKMKIATGELDWDLAAMKATKDLCLSKRGLLRSDPVNV